MKQKSVVIVILVSVILASGIYFGGKAYRRYQNEQVDTVILKDATLEDIDFKSKKVNIYVFWGDGCPHCEELFEFLENSRKKYGKYFNAYGFEVWYNDENGKLLDQVKEEFGEQPGSRAVPYFIVGDQVMSGFDDSIKKELENLIVSKYQDRGKIKQLECFKNRIES